MAVEKLYTPREAAEKLGVTINEIRKQCVEGKIPGAFKNKEGTWQIPEISLDFLKKGALETKHVEPQKIQQEEILSRIFGFCAFVVVVTFIISSISCAVNSKSEYMGFGGGNYLESGTSPSGVQVLLFFVYLAIPLLMFLITQIKKCPYIVRIILIIILAIVAVVYIFPNLLEPASNYAHGELMGNSW